MAEIIVTITDDGLKIDAQGFSDNKCITATAFLKKLGSVQSEKKKPEFYQMKATQQKGELSDD